MPGSVHGQALCFLSRPWSGTGEVLSDATWSGMVLPHFHCLLRFLITHLRTLPALLGPSIHSHTSIFSLEAPGWFYRKGQGGTKRLGVDSGHPAAKWKSEIQSGALFPIQGFSFYPNTSPSLPQKHPFRSTNLLSRINRKGMGIHSCLSLYKLSYPRTYLMQGLVPRWERL